MLIKRARRLRSNILRDIVKETNLKKEDLIYPLFITEGENIKIEIPSMPDIYRMSIDNILVECEELVKLGIKAVILFGIPAHKDSGGTEAYSSSGIIQKAVRAIKSKFKDNLLVITDVCMCEYTDHGHCGIIVDNYVHNDSTVKLLVKIAVSHAEAGADVVAPSDMMDGRVRAIREGLDSSNFQNTAILSYSVKYASAFYGPFRDAVGSAPSFGDRKTYQMDSANRREAIKELEIDIEEGADMVIVKPALSYLDIIREVKDSCNIPVVAYSVSGEYSMIKNAAKTGLVDEDSMILETLNSIKRAGADIIITYFAKQALEKQLIS